MAMSMRKYTQFFNAGSPKNPIERKIKDLKDEIKQSSGRKLNKEADLDQLVEEISDVKEVFTNKMDSNEKGAHFNKCEIRAGKEECVGITFMKKDFLYQKPGTLYLYATENDPSKNVEVKVKKKGKEISENVEVTNLINLYKSGEIITYTDQHI